ncbi:ATP-grasp domain-containing protein [Candidatus Microgenomates bacterium]|nr:ATP-grasp domain-containing protein [Candidatus Microgenomates bacterium]
MGLKVIVLNREKNWAQPYVDYWIIADNTNHNEAIQAIQEFLTTNPKINLDGAITFWEDDVLLTSKIVDKFNLTGIPFNVAQKVRNKFLFRKFCAKNNLPTPKSKLINSPEDLKYIGDYFNFPLVIKPAYGSSSAYIIKVENKDSLFDMYQYVKNNISSSVESALTDGLDIFIEEYIDGDEVDIDILIQNGKIKFFSMADNYNKDKGMFFIDSGQAIPSSLPIKNQEELFEMAEETLEKLGVQHGCIHFEAKCSKKGVYPIEVNIRMGGDYVYSYNKNAWGIDLIEYAVKIATGEYIKIQKPNAPKKYIIGWDLHPNDSGILVELDIPEQIKKNEFIEEIQIYKKIGDPLFVPPEGFEHLGWLTVSGENILDAQDGLDEALKLISYKVVKFDPSSFLGKTERKNRFSSAVLNKNLLIRTAKIQAIEGRDLKNLRRLRIGLLSNIYPETKNPIEEQLTGVTREIEQTLKERGYNVAILNLNNFFDIIDKLQKGDIDLVFNIGERLHNSPEYKPNIASLLDSLQIPYTGSNSFTLSLAADKIRFKKLLAYHKIPTPDWDYLYELDNEINSELEYPLIVKPANADHAVGIDNDSVATNKKTLRQQLKKIIQGMGKPAVIEEYIDGDEYEVYILGSDEDDLKVLPLSRSIFGNLPKDYWHIYTFESKWQNQELNNKIVHQLPPKNISKKLQSLITEIALDTYTIFDCRDYGKVEIKVDKDNNPYVIELNPSPWLYCSRNKGIAAASKLTGIDSGQLLEEIICMCIERYKKQTLPYALQKK